MIKRLVIAAAVATTLGSAIGVASAAPSASVCITSNVNVNGTALPTNGTTCLPPQ